MKRINWKWLPYLAAFIVSVVGCLNIVQWVQSWGGLKATVSCGPVVLPDPVREHFKLLTVGKSNLGGAEWSGYCTVSIENNGPSAVSEVQLVVRNTTLARTERLDGLQSFAESNDVVKLGKLNPDESIVVTVWRSTARLPSSSDFKLSAKESRGSVSIIGVTVPSRVYWIALACLVAVGLVLSVTIKRLIRIDRKVGEYRAQFVEIDRHTKQMASDSRAHLEELKKEFSSISYDLPRPTKPKQD